MVLGARRQGRIERLAERIGGIAIRLDVRDGASIAAFIASVGERFGKIDVLVNNAGLALGRDPIDSTPDDTWIVMWETNVLGLLRVTRESLPLLRRAAHGHIVNIGSVAAIDPQEGGSGYSASKSAVRTISRTLRLELNGEPIRVTEIEPGMSKTEFSLVRSRGDAEAANRVYQGFEPLSADDIAEIVEFVVTRRPNVNIDEVIVRPIAQAGSLMIARREV